ncbi:MAG: hypothetical protein RIT45_1437 [Pseudomonadota bacterium]
MLEPRFLSVQDILDLHTRTIARHGGSPGIRSLALLESAVALPRQSYGDRYLHDDLPAMAAAYLFHIASSHPFVDGNKRAGLAACLAFLLANGVELPWSSAELTRVTMEVASGRMGKGELTLWLRGGIQA